MYVTLCLGKIYVFTVWNIHCTIVYFSRMSIFVTSWEQDEETSSEKLCNAIVQSLRDMRDILQETASSKL